MMRRHAERIACVSFHGEELQWAAQVVRRPAARLRFSGGEAEKGVGGGTLAAGDRVPGRVGEPS